MYDVRRAQETRRRAYTRQLAGRIQAIRIGMGIEPQEMASRLKIPFQTYRAYEEGRRMMPPYVMADLVRISGHGPWFVMTGEAELKAPETDNVTGSHKALRVRA